MVANLLMATGLGITFYYTLCDMPNISERPAIGTLETFPTFFCLTVFAMEAIGVVRYELPIEECFKLYGRMGKNIKYKIGTYKNGL